MSIHQQSTTLSQRSQPAAATKVTVLPGNSTSVGLGMYTSQASAPSFDIAFEPDLREDIGMSEERLELPNQQRYMLFYQFHNFGPKPCEITLRPQFAGSKNA